MTACETRLLSNGRQWVYTCNFKTTMMLVKLLTDFNQWQILTYSPKVVFGHLFHLVITNTEFVVFTRYITKIFTRCMYLPFCKLHRCRLITSHLALSASDECRELVECHV